MKNRNFLKNSIAILLPISMGIGVLLGTANKHINSASAYTKDGTLPTTIDLRDNTAEEINNYYSGLSSLSSSQLQGDNLLKNLKPILKNGQKYFAYDSSGDDLWKMYEIIDRDWEKSPASAITGYSSSTNKITGYTYGTSTSNKGTNPYIHALYVDRNVDNQTRAWDDHQQTQWGINREHIWPKSQGFNAEGAGGARGDPMHLWAGNGRVNGTEHNNNNYGFVDKSETYTNPYEAKGFINLKDNYSGKSLTIPTSTDTVFEPQDCDKGDIARAIFYMVARYNNIAGNDTIDTNNPNLALKQTTQSLASYTTTSSNKQTGYMGLMTDLLYWNHLDPVDEFEIHRNNLLFNNYTHNRNPFIDYPEWADYIWGKPVYNGRNYVSYSSNPTGSVNLSTDVINGFKGEQPAETTVTSIEVTSKPTKLLYNVGETLDTTGMVVKAHLSNNTTRILSSGDYTVSPSGALKVTDTQATVTYEGKSASFAIAVKNSGGGTETQSVTMSFTGSTTTNMTGNNDATTVGLDEESWSVIGDKGGNGNYPGLNKAGQIRLYGSSTNHNIITISSLDGYTIKSATIKYGSSSNNNAKITVGSSEITGSGTDTEKTYTIESDSFSITHNYSGTTQVYISEIEIVYSSSGGSPNVPVTEITLNSSTITTEIGETFSIKPTISPANATVQLVSWSSSNQSVATVNEDGVVTAISDGTATITCSALDGSNITATCTVTVNEPVTLESLSLSGDYATEFYLNDEFSNTGMIVTAHYSDGTSVDVSDEAECSGFDSSTIGTKTITVSYGGKTTTYSITVSSPVVPPTPVGGNVYSKISSLDDIEDGAKYIIGYEDGNTLKAMPNVFAGQMVSSDLTISNDSTVVDPDNEYCVTLSKKTTADSVSVQVSNGTNYLNGASSGTSFSVSTTGIDWTVTINNGSFLFKFGTAARGLLYRTSTYNKFGNYSTTNIGNEYHTISLFKEVTATNNYSLVTDVSDLRTGDKIVIAAPNTYAGITTYYSLSTNRNITSTIYGCEIDFNNNVVTPSDETELITVERNGNDISFKLSDGKYIASYGGSATINLVDSSSDSSARFTVTANTDNSIRLISENTDHSYRRLKFNYSSGNLYYRCYTTNSSTGVDPMIFKYQPQVEADTWAKDFLAKTEYCNLTYWSSLASSYNELSVAAKQEIYSAVSDASTDMNYRAQAMARYEKTLSVKSADAFISERQVDSVRPIYLPIVAPKTDTILIVVFSILGVSAIGGYYFVKRKKEDRV